MAAKKPIKKTASRIPVKKPTPKVDRNIKILKPLAQQQPQRVVYRPLVIQSRPIQSAPKTSQAPIPEPDPQEEPQEDKTQITSESTELSAEQDTEAVDETAVEEQSEESQSNELVEADLTSEDQALLDQETKPTEEKKEKEKSADDVIALDTLKVNDSLQARESFVLEPPKLTTDQTSPSLPTPRVPRPEESILVDPADLNQVAPKKKGPRQYVSIMPIIVLVVTISIVFGSLAVALVGADVIDRCKVSQDFRCVDINITKSSDSIINLGFKYEGYRAVIMSDDPIIKVAGSKTCTGITKMYANNMDWSGVVPLKAESEFVIRLNCSRQPSLGEKLKLEIISNYSDGIENPPFTAFISATVRN